MRLSSQSNVSTNKFSQAESTQSALEVKLRSNKTKSNVKIQMKELDSSKYIISINILDRAGTIPEDAYFAILALNGIELEPKD